MAATTNRFGGSPLRYVLLPTAALLLVGILSGCGGASTTVAVDSSPTVGPPSAPAPVSTTSTGPVVVSVAHGKSQPTDAPIVLTKVVLRTGPDKVEATITARKPLDRASITGGTCALIAVEFVDQKLFMQTSTRVLGSPEDQLVPQAQISLKFLNPRTVQMSVPRSALGARFSATEPWEAYSEGPGCPPMAMVTDNLPVVTPHRATA